ncbi:MAG: hypothetical protein KAJ58_00665 [Candidatus Pacebacteria bacterium]|nr:hypothetical protein [Candidatus Paceibacterota bacterium]
MEGKLTQVKPLILDFAETVKIVYEGEQQVVFGGTSIGTHDEPDSAGLD